MSSPKITVTHIITGLKIGGAEIMLCRLLEHSDQFRFRHRVISLSGKGQLADRIKATGSTLHYLNLNRPTCVLPDFVRLVRLLKEPDASIVQTWLTHANLFGAIAAKMAGVRSLIWTIHTGNQAESALKWSLRLITRVLAILSHHSPTVIVSCSDTASKRHQEIGFAREKIVTIPNGTDTTSYQPFPDAAESFYQGLGIPKGTPVIGIAGRWTPEKDYDTFFQAALLLQERVPETHFIACGSGLDQENAKAGRYIQNSSLRDHFHLLGQRDDLPVVFSGMRIFALTSISEAFPLVLGEAMACGVPCVSTNVGDCEKILGETGKLTPTGEPEAIATVWEEMIRLPQQDYQRQSRLARERIVQNFSMESCVASYEQLFRELAVHQTEADRRDLREPIPLK